jgi:hypothetical protein
MQSIKRVYCLILLGSVSSGLRAQSCEGLRNGEFDAAVKYLKGQIPDRMGICIADALDRMGEAAQTSDVDVLLTFLDYVRPVQPGIPIYSPRAKRNAQYPAEVALEERGKVVLPWLLELLGWGNPSKLVRDNALRAYMVINRDDHIRAVSILMQMAKAVRDRPDLSKEASPNFLAAAKDAVSLCGQEVRETCESLLASQ